MTKALLVTVLCLVASPAFATVYTCNVGLFSASGVENPPPIKVDSTKEEFQKVVLKSGVYGACAGLPVDKQASGILCYFGDKDSPVKFVRTQKKGKPLVLRKNIQTGQMVFAPFAVTTDSAKALALGIPTKAGDGMYYIDCE